MRRALCLAALLAPLAGLGAARAEDDGVPPADLALLEGRIGDLDAQALGWRTYEGARGAHGPVPRGPVARALLRDRERRETVGVAGLPEAGPLTLPGEGAGDPQTAALLAPARDLQRWLYRPVLPEDDPNREVADAARLQARRRDDLRRQAWTWALGSLLALLAVAGTAARRGR